jgi:hypothetical protein
MVKFTCNKHGVQESETPFSYNLTDHRRTAFNLINSAGKLINNINISLPFLA